MYLHCVVDYKPIKEQFADFKRTVEENRAQSELNIYYLAKGRLRIMHGAENGRERAMVYIGSGNVFNEATVLAGFDDPDCRFYCMEDVELYRFPGTLLHDPRFVSSSGRPYRRRSRSSC